MFAFLFLFLSLASGQQQYTPDLADWSFFYPANMDHSPNGVTWVNEWLPWDGTVYNPNKMTKAELAKAICPHADAIRGIRDLFYKVKPFRNNFQPTKAEVDAWTITSLNHVRAMVGYTGAREVKPDICLFARALWGQQRMKTRMWDAKYPGTCAGTTNAHCGAGFLPDAADQAPYLPPGHPTCGKAGGAEGITSAPKCDIPWSVKWGRALCSFLATEGFWGGHTGPWFHREKIGLSYWPMDKTNPRSNAIVRAKFSGQLFSNLYPFENNVNCEDGMLNGDEEDVDCGGSCPACVHPGCQWKSFGDNKVAEGYHKTSLRTIYTPLPGCYKACNDNPDCNSFVQCGGCYLKSGVLTGKEPTVDHGSCTSYYRDCTGTTDDSSSSDDTSCPNNCMSPPVCHAPGSCNAGTCTFTPVADGTPCDDNNGHTSGDSCKGGVCSGCRWKSKGHLMLAPDSLHGANVGRHWVGVEQCKKQCDANHNCHSFVQCGGCYLKGNSLDGTEPFSKHSHCTSWYYDCSPSLNEEDTQDEDFKTTDKSSWLLFVAGACVMVAVVVLAVGIKRRQQQQPEQVYEIMVADGTTA